jgi:hypothetical protein
VGKVTSSEIIVTFFQRPVTSSEIIVTFFQTPVTSREIIVTFIQIPVTSSEIIVTFFRSPVTSSEIIVTFFQSLVTSSEIIVSFFSNGAHHRVWVPEQCMCLCVLQPGCLLLPCVKKMKIDRHEGGCTPSLYVSQFCVLYNISQICVKHIMPLPSLLYLLVLLFFF